MEHPSGMEIAARPQSNAPTAAIVSREQAEVQGAIIVAQKFPRNAIEALQRILNACQRPTLAEGAIYSYPRGGKQVEGPSIRLAEVLAQEWGNIAFGVRELEQRNGESIVEAFAWDMEKNVRQSKTFTVKHQRKARGEVHNLEDPRDIYEMTANQGARRLRACILGVIPGDIVEEAVKESQKTVATRIDVTPDGIKRMLEAFKEHGVTKAMIEKRIQRKVDSILPAQMMSLKSIMNSLKDGMSSPAEWFEMEQTETAEADKKGNDAVKDALKGKDK